MVSQEQKAERKWQDRAHKDPKEVSKGRGGVGKGMTEIIPWQGKAESTWLACGM